MKCKVLISAALAVVACTTARAQNDSVYTPICTNEKGLIEKIFKLEKHTDAFNLYLNMHGGLENYWTGSKFDETKFNMRQLRIEMKGNINSWISYRYRQRLNTGDATTGFKDNVLRSIGWAAVTFKVKKWAFTVGKQCAIYGGIEFDLNPIEIYEYSDMIANINNFTTGLCVTYNLNSRQQFQVQTMNSIKTTSQAMYGDYEKIKVPLMYSVAWNANIANVWKPRWSATYMPEVKGRHEWYFALGNNFSITPRLSAYFDWMYSRQGVDRMGIMTKIVAGDDAKYNTMNVDYNSFVLHANYMMADRWNIFAKGMYETAGTYQEHEGIPKGNYRTSWGYVGGVEYYPMKQSNLHFFVAYAGRAYKFTERARERGMENYNTNRLSAGFIWQMPIF